MNKKPLIILLISVSIAIGFIYIHNNNPEFIKSSQFIQKFVSYFKKNTYNNEKQKNENIFKDNASKKEKNFESTEQQKIENKELQKKKESIQKNIKSEREKETEKPEAKKETKKSKIKKEIKQQEEKKENKKNEIKKKTKESEIKKEIKEHLEKEIKKLEEKNAIKEEIIKPEEKKESKNTEVKKEIKESSIKDTKKNDKIMSEKNILNEENKINELLEKDEEYDIIIVGAGLAGVTATYESYLKSKGKLKIVLLEKQKNFGGNSAKATSGINILNSPLQKAQNVKDTYDLFFSDTMKSGKGRSVPDLVSTLVEDSVSVFNFFTDIKADLSKLGLLGGHSVPRTCRPTNATVGYHLTSVVYKTLLNLTGVIFSSNSTVVELIYNPKIRTVQGVKVIINGKEKILKSKTVILTCGGFGHDFDSQDSLLKEYVPNIMKFPTTNGPQTTGMGVKIARNIGADLVDMDQVQIHPTGYVDYKDRFSKNKILAPELLRGVGGILINQKGERFCNELGTRDYVTEKIIKNCEKIQNKFNIDQYESFLILNENAAQKFGTNINFYIKKGLFKKYNNFEDFAQINKIDFKNLKNTIVSYNEFAKSNKPDQFGKIVYPEKFNLEQPIYVAVISPVIHYCMGGIKINKETEVITTVVTTRKKKKKKNTFIINGLFAAGEVTGGVHGGNRLGGNSLLECAVFGRRAANSAIRYIEKLDKK
jgi:flavocytochrome c